MRAGRSISDSGSLALSAYSLAVSGGLTNLDKLAGAARAELEHLHKLPLIFNTPNARLSTLKSRQSLAQRST